jgi:hypothetical protein
VIAAEDGRKSSGRKKERGLRYALDVKATFILVVVDVDRSVDGDVDLDVAEKR